MFLPVRSFLITERELEKNIRDTVRTEVKKSSDHDEELVDEDYTDAVVREGVSDFHNRQADAIGDLSIINSDEKVVDFLISLSEYLSFEDLLSLSLASRTLFLYVHANEDIWKRLCARDVLLKDEGAGKLNYAKNWRETYIRSKFKLKHSDTIERKPIILRPICSTRLTEPVRVVEAILDEPAWFKINTKEIPKYDWNQYKHKIRASVYGGGMWFDSDVPFVLTGMPTDEDHPDYYQSWQIQYWQSQAKKVWERTKIGTETCAHPGDTPSFDLPIFVNTHGSKRFWMNGLGGYFNASEEKLEFMSLKEEFVEGYLGKGPSSGCDESPLFIFDKKLDQLCPDLRNIASSEALGLYKDLFRVWGHKDGFQFDSTLGQKEERVQPYLLETLEWRYDLHNDSVPSSSNKLKLALLLKKALDRALEPHTCFCQQIAADIGRLEYCVLYGPILEKLECCSSTIERSLLIKELKSRQEVHKEVLKQSITDLSFSNEYNPQWSIEGREEMIKQVLLNWPSRSREREVSTTQGSGGFFIPGITSNVIRCTSGDPKIIEGITDLKCQVLADFLLEGPLDDDLPRNLIKELSSERRIPIEACRSLLEGGSLLQLERGVQRGYARVFREQKELIELYQRYFSDYHSVGTNFVVDRGTEFSESAPCNDSDPSDIFECQARQWYSERSYVRTDSEEGWSECGGLGDLHDVTDIIVDDTNMEVDNTDGLPLTEANLALLPHRDWRTYAPVAVIVDTDASASKSESPQPTKVIADNGPTDVQLPESYSCPDNGDFRPDNRWLLFGNRGSGSKWHYDPNHTTATNLTLSGAKKWFFYPPGLQAPPGVYPSPDLAEVMQPTSILEWGRDFYRQFTEGGQVQKPGAGKPMTGKPIEPLEVITRKGDLMYIPSRWWHAVVNISSKESTVAVTENFISPTNLDSCLTFLKDKPEQISGVSKCQLDVKLDHDPMWYHNQFRELVKEKRPDVWALHTGRERERREEEVRRKVEEEEASIRAEQEALRKKEEQARKEKIEKENQNSFMQLLLGRSTGSTSSSATTPNVPSEPVPSEPTPSVSGTPTDAQVGFSDSESSDWEKPTWAASRPKKFVKRR